MELNQYLGISRRMVTGISNSAVNVEKYTDCQVHLET